MKRDTQTKPDSISPPAIPRARKLQSDPSLFATSGAGLLLHYEDPNLLAFVRNAAELVIQPANDMERIFTELAVRQLWRAIRSGGIETPAIDAEIADHSGDVRARWGELHPSTEFHLCTRDPATRAALREYATLEKVALRSFKETRAILLSMRS